MGSPGAKYPKMNVIKVTLMTTKISPMNRLTRNCAILCPLASKLKVANIYGFHYKIKRYLSK
jgi:hypothetical protein